MLSLSLRLPPAPKGRLTAPALATLVTAAFFASTASADSFDPSRARLVDLTHPFKEGGVTVDKVPLSRLFAPVVVIDVSAATISQRDYELQLGDIVAFETIHGPIPRGAIALMRTGWSKRWDDKKEYLGDDTPGDASNLHFPGFGEEAAHVLVEQRGVAAIGLDTASLDPGKSTQFLAHRIAAAAGVPGFENLTNLEQLPPSGAWMMALPMMIDGGTGAPLRAVALVPEGR